jgi:hypothetical protein
LGHGVAEYLLVVKLEYSKFWIWQIEDMVKNPSLGEGGFLLKGTS